RKNGALIGEVTSGTFSPTLKKNIGLGYVAAAEAYAGNEIGIQVRDKVLNARIVPLPFYKRQK
ncbi:MAG: glycine cleavage system aminomethyltransferase GcvT, partial [Candidatus Omnitrophica bacterium]|nr:glycine cleavage system aminomethyltransferase GcvT [Candidatus Omnitrophota bacterium]